MNNSQLIKKATLVSKKHKLSKNVFSGGVGAAIITKSGNLFLGSNLECDCDIGYCAEVSAISAMLLSGESEIDQIVVINRSGKFLTPCGRCREIIYQINPNNVETEIIMGPKKTEKLDKLLPYRWQDIN